MEIPSLDSSWTLFLDRDGVINRKLEADYVKRVEEFEWLAGAADAITLLNQVFGRTFIVTNQAGIGKGLMTATNLEAVHGLLLRDLVMKGGYITAIYHCPHRPDAGCECRKPRTGMPLQAQREHPEVNFSKAVMVGDSVSDLEMGRALGVITVLIGPPYTDRAGLYDFQYYSLREFADAWVNHISPMQTSGTVFSPGYWDNRYIEKSSPWDLGKPSAPIMDFMSRYPRKDARILMPGGGGGHEAAALFQMGYQHVYLLDWSQQVVDTFLRNYPFFPASQVICSDFFKHEGLYDLILEQTFYCAIPPTLRDDYVRHSASLLKPGGTLAGVMFSFPLVETGPPWGGDEAEYRQRFSPFFEVVKIEHSTISEPSRQGREVLVEFRIH